MNKEKHNSKEILTKNISIKEFAEIFAGIDEQIHQLHQCSSDDFLGLNADFKQYYKQSKQISENASKIFQELTKDESVGLLKDIEKLYKDLKQIQNEFSKLLKNSSSLLNEMVEQLDLLFLPVKNLNQDLLTLKFLLAYLKISNSASPKTKEINFDKLIQRFNEVINEFKIQSFQNESNLELLKEVVHKTNKLFNEIKEKNVSDLDAILNNIHLAIILFAEKHEEVSRQIPDLSQQTESSSKSIADIITNLQYHDIIRQKMEHVHATHKKLLNDLEETANSHDADSPENHTKLLIRVRDIANLQSAQLVYANKEYQQAIEVITNKFMSIGADMTTISGMCQGINASQDNADELHLQGLIDKLKDSENVLGKFLKATDSFTSNIDMLTAQVANSSRSVAKFSSSLSELKEITGQTLKAFEDAQVEDEELRKSLSQIQELYSDVEKFEGVIQQVYSKIENSGGKLLPNIGQNLKNAKQSGSFSQTAEAMKSIISNLNHKNLQVKSLLEDNQSISNSISMDVKTSINKIKYYDFFEKVIVDIISEFNRIHQLIRAEVVSDEEKAHELDSIKNLYTMASEHNIHDKVTQSEGEIDLFDDDESPKSDEEDDNLELF